MWFSNHFPLKRKLPSGGIMQIKNRGFSVAVFYLPEVFLEEPVDVCIDVVDDGGQVLGLVAEVVIIHIHNE